MNIACLGWGSLIWDPGSLPLRPNAPPRWFTDGPELPVEFARQSGDGRITLVIVPAQVAKPQPVLWAYLTSPNIADAHEALARREWGRDPLPRQWTSQDWTNWKERNIARWTQQAGLGAAHTQQIAAWANGRKLDGVVWTILRPRIGGVERVATCAEVVNYLNGLTGSKRQGAEGYVRKAPCQIRTNCRAAIEGALNWTCDPSATQHEIISPD
jgi:hypothetical protein